MTLVRHPLYGPAFWAGNVNPQTCNPARLTCLEIAIDHHKHHLSGGELKVCVDLSS